jgi:hypothetical protein
LVASAYFLALLGSGAACARRPLWVPNSTSVAMNVSALSTHGAPAYCERNVRRADKDESDLRADNCSPAPVNWEEAPAERPLSSCRQWAAVLFAARDIIHITSDFFCEFSARPFHALSQYPHLPPREPTLPFGNLPHDLEIPEHFEGFYVRSHLPNLLGLVLATPFFAILNFAVFLTSRQTATGRVGRLREVQRTCRGHASPSQSDPMRTSSHQLHMSTDDVSTELSLHSSAGGKVSGNCCAASWH